MLRMISLKPPTSPAEQLNTSILKRRCSQKRRYMVYKSPANRAASLPPVPARISMITDLMDASSPVTSAAFTCWAKSSQVSLSSPSSSSARARSSGSCVLSRMISSVSASSTAFALYCRYGSTTRRSRESFLLSSIILVGLPATAPSFICERTSSWCWESSSSLFSSDLSKNDSDTSQ